jgi:Cysteine-rich CWC
MGTTEGQRQVICESCGATFGCCPVPKGGCWCADIGISNAALEELKAKFTECICPECLVKHARENAPKP